MERLSAEEMKWRARDDARTLARAEEIKADKERMKLAQEGAREILNEESKRLNGLNKVAGRKTPKTTETPKEEFPVRNSANRNAMFGSFPTRPIF